MLRRVDDLEDLQNIAAGNFLEFLVDAPLLEDVCHFALGLKHQPNRQVALEFVVVELVDLRSACSYLREVALADKFGPVQLVGASEALRSHFHASEFLIVKCNCVVTLR